MTVSVLLSWTNMIGWIRDFSDDFKGAIEYRQSPTATVKRMSAAGIVLRESFRR